MMKNIPLNEKRSFTIIETVIAIALVAITSTVFLASAITSFGYLRHTNELRAAALALQKEVSLVRIMKFQDISTLGATFTPEGVSMLNNPIGTIGKSQYGGQSTILKITFMLNWTGFDGRPATKSIVTLMTDHGINKR